MVGELLCADPVCRTIAGIPASLLPARLRIVVQAAGTAMGQDPLVAAFHQDLVAALVVKGQQDETLVVTRHLAATWPVPVGRLWDDALVALGMEPLNVQGFQLSITNAPAYAINGQGWPGAAHMFRLERAIGRPLPHGALVVLTTDNAFVTLPLESNATLRATAALWELNGALARDTPRALPPRLLWIRGWTVHDLGAGLADGQFSFDLPQDLRAVLAGLP